MNFRLIFAFILMSLVACNTATTEEDNGKMKIVATTTILADVIGNVVGDKADVYSLMGAGVDPHIYQATPSDLTLLKEADLIIYHGLHLEGKMIDVFEKLDDKSIAFTAGYDDSELIVLDEHHYDPHTWFDVNLQIVGVKYISNALSEVDADNADFYIANAKDYIEKLTELDTYITTQIASISEEKRIIISTHDAFEYFGKKYGMQTHGIQGVSTATEAGIKDITATVDIVVENKIPVVFSETSASSGTIEAVMQGSAEKGWQVSIAAPLYTDALGNVDDGADTYIGMVRANVDNLVKSLNR